MGKDKDLKSYQDIVTPINEIGEEINQILNNNVKDKYFYGVILCYSLIENLLRWLVFIEAIWRQSAKGILLSQKETDRLMDYCRELSFFNTEMIAFFLNLIDLKLWNQIKKIRKERNNIVHKLWIYKRRSDFRFLRKKLEKLTNIVNQLVKTFNKLTKRIGVDEVYAIILE